MIKICRVLLIVVSIGIIACSKDEIIDPNSPNYNPSNPSNKPIPSNEIHYTSYDGQLVVPYNKNAFGAFLINNIYEKGIGILVFEEDVTEIGEEAFLNCETLTSITFPSTISGRMGKRAFSGCSSLRNVIIPKKISEIDYGVFENCTELVSIVFEKGSQLKTIYGGYYYSGSGGKDNPTKPCGAFTGCTSLTRITIPASVEFINESAFYGCTHLQNVTFEAGSQLQQLGVLSRTSSGRMYDFGVFCGCSALNSIAIPNSVKTIGFNAFSGCSNLKNINIPKGITTIGSNTFYKCNNLESIIIPDSVTEIGSSAFYGCSSLKDITLSNNITEINSYAFYGCSSLKDIVIPKSVTKIDMNAFGVCDNIQIHISDLSAWCRISFGDMGNPLSNNNSGLYLNGKLITDLVIPNDVTTISDYAFYGYEKLLNINFHNNFRKVGVKTFYKCTGLTTLTLPISIRELDDCAFQGCSNLVEIYCKATTPPYIYCWYYSNGSGSFHPFKDTNNAPIYVPTESLSAYQSNTYWRTMLYNRIFAYNF